MYKAYKKALECEKRHSTCNLKCWECPYETPFNLKRTVKELYYEEAVGIPVDRVVQLLRHEKKRKLKSDKTRIRRSV